MSKLKKHRRWRKYRRQRCQRGETAGSKVAVTTSLATVRDARTRITLDRVDELSSRLHIPVTLDRTGWLRDGIEVQYARGPDATIRPTMARFGHEAIVDDLLAHDGVIGRCTRYNEALGDLRKLWDRLDALVQRGQTPLNPGSAVWDAYQSLRRLDDLVASRQSARMGQGTVSVETLDHEIEFFQRQHAHLLRTVATAETMDAHSDRARCIDGGGDRRTVLGDGTEHDHTLVAGVSTSTEGRR